MAAVAANIIETQGGDRMTVFDMVAVAFAVMGAVEMAVARYFADAARPNAKLIASLLLWEGVAMLACAAALYARQSFDMQTIVSLIAFWTAGAAVGLLRGGAFDGPRK